MYRNLFTTFIVVFLVMPTITWAACSWVGNTGTPASNSVAEVGYCISDASSKTGEVIVNLNAGTTSWASAVAVNMSSGFTNVTKLSIIGAGTIPTGTTTGAATSGGTTISIGSSAYINYTGSLAKKFRVSNITFTGADARAIKVSAYGTTKSSEGGGFRFDHITFNRDSAAHSNAHALEIDGINYGVVDHCYMHKPQPFAWNGNGVGPDQVGQTRWSTELFPGGVHLGDALFFEANEILCGIGNTSDGSPMNCMSEIMMCDGNEGARTVFRYNRIVNHYIGAHDSLGPRGQMWTEVYNNDWTRTVLGGMSPDSFDLRGGTGVVYRNLIQCDSSNVNECWLTSWFDGNSGIHLITYRGCNQTGNSNGLFTDMCTSSQTPRKACFGSGATWSDSYCSQETDCGGTNGVTSYCRYIDNQDGEQGRSPGVGYPCRDEIGRWIDNAKKPYLFWGNRVKLGASAETWATIGVDYTCLISGGRDNDYIVEDRDYCINSSSYTMPTTCNGVTTVYAPYACPHPLTELLGTCDANVIGLDGYNVSGVSSITGINITGGSFR